MEERKVHAEQGRNHMTGRYSALGADAWVSSLNFQALLRKGCVPRGRAEYMFSFWGFVGGGGAA